MPSEQISLLNIPAAGEAPESPEHARRLISALCMELLRSKAKRDLVLYFVDAFKKVREGASADVVLGLKRDRSGRPQRIETEGIPYAPRDIRDLFLAGIVFELSEAGHKLKYAYSNAAEHWNMNRKKGRPAASPSTAQRAWKHYQNSIRIMAEREKDLPEEERSSFINGKLSLCEDYFREAVPACETSRRVAKKNRCSKSVFRKKR